MKLGMRVGLDPRHIVLDGDPAHPPPKGSRAPKVLAHICCGQIAAGVQMPLGMEVGLRPGDFVLNGDAVPPPKKGHPPKKFFRPMFIVAKRLDGSRWHLAWRYASAQATLC